MNWPHVHLIINHFPVIGLIFAVLLFGVAFIRKSEELNQLTLGALVFIALTVVPVYLTGQASGEMDAVKNLPGVTENIISTHQEVASLALVMISALGIAALGGLIFYRRSTKIPAWFMGLLLAGTLASAAVTGLTANLGGQIRHTEIREGFAIPHAPEPAKHDEQKKDR